MSEEKLPVWKRFFMWDYPRGSMAYDVKVGLILAFIFLTPGWVFRDAPQLAKPRSAVVMLPGSASENRFWLEPSWAREEFGLSQEGNAAFSPEKQEALADTLSKHTGKPVQVLRLETLRSAQGNVQGFVAVTTP